MPSILFVCTGNIHRSPIAMAILRRKLSLEDMNDDWIVESAGTWATPGLPASREVHHVLNEINIDIRDHRSRFVSRELLDRFDLILTMEMGQKEAIRAEFPEVASRVYLLSEMVGYNQNVEDPIGGTIEDFRATVREIDSLVTQGFKRICEITQRQE